MHACFHERLLLPLGLEADEESGSAAAARSERSDRRVPGELLEVVVEKLLAAGVLHVMSHYICYLSYVTC
jgi:hypothetical protein